MKGDFKNELQIRLTLTIIYTALNILVKTGDIREFETSSTKIIKDVTGKVKYTQSPQTFIINEDKYPLMRTLIAQIRLLRQVSFYPKIVKYNRESRDPILNSKDKVNQINALNSVKVYFNHDYADYLFDEVLQLVGKNNNKLAAILGTKTIGELQAAVQALAIFQAYYVRILQFISILEVDHYYNIFFTDSRGRVYPKLTQFRHIR
jgi:hypothetical protein